MPSIIDAPTRTALRSVVSGDEASMLSALAWLRRHAPVIASDDGKRRRWTVTRHEHVAAVLTDTAAFSSEYGNMLHIAAQPDPAAGRMLTLTDPPRHGELRGVFHQSMTGRSLAELTELVRQAIDNVLDDAIAAGRVEFVSAVADRLAGEFTCQLLGIPLGDRVRLTQLSAVIFAAEGMTADPARAVASRTHASAELIDYFLDRVSQARTRPGEDFISRLTHAVRGNLLDDMLLALNCVNLLLGGLETTRTAAVGGMLALHRFPDQFRLLRQRPDLGLKAAEEFIRWTTPIRQLLRMCTTATELGGQTLQRGDVVEIWLLSANRDETVFTAPDALRIDRWPNRHLSFGHGSHRCVGRGYGRLELSQLFSAIALRGVRFVPQVPPVPLPTPLVTAYAHVPVRVEWDTAM